METITEEDDQPTKTRYKLDNTWWRLKNGYVINKYCYMEEQEGDDEIVISDWIGDVYDVNKHTKHYVNRAAFEDYYKLSQY